KSGKCSNSFPTAGSGIPRILRRWPVGWPRMNRNTSMDRQFLWMVGCTAIPPLKGMDKMETMDLGIKGRTAVVTGADSGIGLATALALAEEGVHLVLTDLGEEGLDRAMAQVRERAVEGYGVLGLPADITKEEEVRDLAQRVKEDFGGAHILVHSAGIRGASGDFLELTDREWAQTIEVDLMGAVRICRAFIPQMQELDWGRLVLIASENAYQPYGDESPYNACKAAILNLSKHLSRAYSREDLLINCVSPAFIRTP